MIENRSELDEFLKKHGSAKIVTAGVLNKNWVSVTSGIPTICGAEIMCHPSNYDEVIDIVGKSNDQK